MTTNEPTGMMYFLASAVVNISDDYGNKKDTEYQSATFRVAEYPSEEDLKELLTLGYNRSWKRVKNCTILSYCQLTKEQYDAY